MTTLLKDYTDIVQLARANSGDVQQIVLQRRANPAIIVQLFADRLVTFDQGISVLKQLFRTAKDVREEENVLLYLMEFLVRHLKRTPVSGYPDSLIGTPFFGCQEMPYDHLLSVLKEKEYLAEFVIVTFFQHPEEEIRRIAPVYLRSLLLSIFASYKNKDVLRSIWRFLNQFKDDLCRKLVKDIVVLSCEKSFQPELLCICFECLDVEKNPSDARDFLLLLAVRLQDDTSDSKVNRSLNVMERVIDQVELNSTQLEVILYSIGRIIDRVNSTQLPHLVSLLMKIIQKSPISSLTLNMILDPIIQWFSSPTPLIPKETYQSFEEIIQRAQNSQIDREIPLEDLLSWNDLMIHDKEVTLVISYTRLNIVLQRNPDSLSLLIAKWKRLCPIDFRLEDVLLIRSLVLSPLFTSHLKDVLDQFKLVANVTRIPQTLSITPFLFKLVKERDPKCQLLLLKILPEFTANPSNIPIILSTLRKLDQVPGLDLICLELYHQMSLKEYRATSRVIQHLEYLQSKRNKSLEMCLAMITIIRRICQQRKNAQSCREMVRLISHLINEDCANGSEGVVMVVALDAIQILCENSVINVQSTWRAIKENFHNESRKNVKLKLYNFFRAIPQLAADESFQDGIMSLLWRDLMTTTDRDLIENIFLALREFPFDSMCFVRFPETFRQNVKLPKSHLTNVPDDEYTATFPYIPGECWIELLEKIPQQALLFSPLFIAKFIDLELKALRTPTDSMPEGRSEPKTITGVQPKSILKALLNYLVVETRNGFPETEQVRCAIVKCLSVGFSKPLPHLDWTFLGDVYQGTLELREDILKIVCRQTVNSVSARKFLADFLNKFDVATCGLQQVLILMANFHRIEKCLDINEAEILLRNCLEWSEKKQQDDDGFEAMLVALPVTELNADLRRIVEEVLMQRYSLMTEEERDSDKWTCLVQRMGSGFVKELREELTEELRIKKQVDLLLRNPRDEAPSEKIILMQLIASKLKLSRDEDELEFYGNLLIQLVVNLSNLSAIDVNEAGAVKARDWGRFLKALTDQQTVKEGLNQVLTCVFTRVSGDESEVARRLKMGLCGSYERV